MARVLLGLFRLVCFGLALSALGVAALIYLAATGEDLWVLHRAVGAVGDLMRGQHTTHLSIRAELLPEQGRLDAEATVTVHADAPRDRFFFLLHPDLRVRSAAARGAQGTPLALRTARLWLLQVVALDEPVAAGEQVQLTFHYDGRPTKELFGGGDAAISPDGAILEAGALWHPTDAQGFFTVDATVVAPANLVVVHNGVSTSALPRGRLRETRWQLNRPVAGMALVAGRYSTHELDVAGVSYRIHLAEDVDLDSARLQQQLADANQVLTTTFGESGFRQITLFVTRTLRRAFNDGTGLIGASIHYFRNGDYGFNLLAHEVAHNWWGGTVSEQWLTPSTGGQWIVEGFATYSSWIATEARFGRAGVLRAMERDFFDPARQGVIADMSFLDNILTEARARHTIYRKGGLTAWMLRARLGPERYDAALRELISRYRQQQASARDLQAVLEEVAEADLSQYFDDWIRSDRLADLAFEKTPEGLLRIANHGRAVIDGELEVLVLSPEGAPARELTARVEETIDLGADGEAAIVDPRAQWVDVERENNRFPQRDDPIRVAPAPDGGRLVAAGSPYPWSRATVRQHDASGQVLHTWDLERGLLAPPTWNAAGTRVLLSVSDAREPVASIVVLETAGGGTKRLVGSGDSPAFAADGTIFAARDDSLIAIAEYGDEEVFRQRKRWRLGQPRPSPDDRWVAYTAVHNNLLELRLASRQSGEDRRLLAADRDRVLIEWGRDSSTVYLGMGDDWDWQIIEVPVADGATRVLADGIAELDALALAPDGARLAFAAAPDLDYPQSRSLIYLLDLNRQAVETIDVPDHDVESMAWEDAQRLLVIGRREESPAVLPARYSLRRVDTSSGEISAVD